ncbi:mannose-1-phosphate guanylyltransferase [Nematocida sp. AWRm80]|nr:mannose-1-phosphate guanylyltransferase [Nematocida sp. AWRm80]
MKGIILVGGLGTRLRPLTLTEPKPLVPFVNKPILQHQIEALVRVGVTEIILAVGHMQDHLREVLEGYDKELGIRVTYSIEESPMGTAGPLSLLRESLEKEEDPFFVLNSDVICAFPFKEMLRLHKEHQGEGTILVTKVEEPSKYGVILTDTTGRITEFVEKPKEFVGDRINAGIYIFNRNILKYIENRPMSLEKDVLPNMIKEKVVKTYNLDGFWMDIGQPKDYLKGQSLYLSEFYPEKRVIHPTAKVSPKAVIGENTVIGPRAVIEAGAEISNSVIFEGCVVKENALIADSIIGWQSQVGKWTRIEECSVLGAHVQVQEGIYITSAIIQPNTNVSLHMLLPRISSLQEVESLSASPTDSAI